MMRVVVVTGMSGAGKSVALRALEDAGYYAIDNLPIPMFLKLIAHGETPEIAIQKLALAVDTRDARHLGELPAHIRETIAKGHEVEIAFFDASDATLERRFSETRRRHPLAIDRTVKEAIAQERLLLMQLLEMASFTINTSELSTPELKREVTKRVARGVAIPMGLVLLSFGFRHGVPSEADLVFDVRFLPNPFFVEALRSLTGEDDICAQYILERPETQAFLALLSPMLDFLLPQYEQEGKSYLTIAFGCTGGQHRSVTIARHVAEAMRERGREVRVRHRDMRVTVASQRGRDNSSSHSLPP